jgi:hypothetical protein
MKIREITSNSESSQDQKITQLLSTYFDIPDEFDIEDDGRVSTSGPVEALGKFFQGQMPVRFGHVGNSFSCANSGLTSLDGCPLVVDMNFDCRNNRITNLVGGPQSVGLTYFADQNLLLRSLTGLPKDVKVLIIDYHPDLPLIPALNAQMLFFSNWSIAKYPHSLVQSIAQIINKHNRGGKYNPMRFVSEMLTLEKQFSEKFSRIDLRNNIGK